MVVKTNSSHNSELLTHPKYRADIDGLRAVAVLSVVGFHAFPYLVTGGFIGVDIFFVISGFLISTIIFGNLEHNSFSYREFYKRRVRRIFPALIVIFIACIAFGWFVLLADEYKLLGQHTLAGTAFISNFVLWNESGYFGAAAETKPLLHLWSLAIEEQFYIFWPLLLGFVWRRKWNFLAITAAVALISLALDVYSIHDNPIAAFYSPVSRFWELMIGGLLAYIMLHKPSLISKHHNAQSILGLLLLVTALLLINERRAFPGWWALLPTVGTFLLISSGSNAWFNKKFLSNKLVVWFGLISYPLYLWHWPLLSFALIVNNYDTTPRIIRLGIVFLAIFLAWLTYKFIEKPIRAGNKSTTLFLVGGFCITGILAAIVNFNNGFSQRSINKNEEKLFVNSYRNLYINGLYEYYQEKCDFNNWSSGTIKNEINKECTELKNNQIVYLLWGDSHAQALSFGFRQNILSEIKLAQITTSACQPKIHHDSNNWVSKACMDSNNYAIEFIKKNKPSKVFVAQSAAHELTDWEEISQFVKSNNGELILIGPVPQWRPSLPALVAKNLSLKKEYVSEGLDATIFETNEKLKKKYTNAPFRYISIIDNVCKNDGCKAIINTQEKFNLIVMDYGHLTPAGSDYVVKNLILEKGVYRK